MANLSSLSALLSDYEVGTMTKPPKLVSLNEYSSWSARFESFLSIVNPSLTIPLIEGYEQPQLNGVYKNVSRLTKDEKKLYDLDKKAYALLTMALPKEIFQYFDDELKRSKRTLLKKQLEVFKCLDNKTFQELVTRYTLLLSELSNLDYEVSLEEQNDKLLDALPSSWETYVRNDERGRKPCTKRSPGLPEIEKRRKITKCWSIGPIAVRDGGIQNPPRYAMHERNLRSPDFFAISCKKIIFLLLASVLPSNDENTHFYHLNPFFKPSEVKDRTKDHLYKLRSLF
ncbi:hypothetical protein E3N88_29634 [Mikania micrantha]|uniref:Uncharacterized protein n=1 Tax=Mikania micrantha TaxID=192012 RepID=A0A5N6MJE1_9ASTR|nr:hypothetical protein E3N88_29634 [Mikania micrantha]